ncbi:hypothetical protein [Zhenpiania hominis]|uniref:Uncharacterized protein n=1 Tax=Zhenpiania hominis TaxID=2763644 RepID=A0A923SSI0_9FIRM|nr:hypothetical protein [Zhenpiania hominis]MBC6680399.1 hypothetical protein [Zhenpiania hominis]
MKVALESYREMRAGIVRADVDPVPLREDDRKKGGTAELSVLCRKGRFFYTVNHEGKGE